MVKFTCLNCGQIAETYPSQSARFCSSACYHSFRSRIVSDQKCEECGQIFTGRFSVKYCSEKCKRKRDHRAEKQDFVNSCPRCGKQRVVRRPPHLQKHTHCRQCAGFIARETNTPRGKESKQWKGGRRVDGFGYIKVHLPGHPFADSTNYVREHLAVVTEKYGDSYVRERGGVVHHINGEKQDNRPDNLYVCTHSENKAFNAQLLSMAFQLVNAGVIQFDHKAGKYRCPLLGDEKDEAAQSR